VHRWRFQIMCPDILVGRGTVLNTSPRHVSEDVLLALLLWSGLCPAFWPLIVVIKKTPNSCFLLEPTRICLHDIFLNQSIALLRHNRLVKRVAENRTFYLPGAQGRDGLRRGSGWSRTAAWLGMQPRSAATIPTRRLRCGKGTGLVEK
jgi:hypothetical protein